MTKDEEIKLSQMISLAGMAKSSYVTAIEKAKGGHFEEAREIIAQGDDYYSQCHKIHAQMLSENVETLDCNVHLFLVHAEDQMMSVETIKIMAEQMIGLYQIITKGNP